MSRKALGWLCLSLLILVLDQWTKGMAVERLVLHAPYPLLEWLNLTLTYNTGAAFSLLRDAGGWQRWFFIILTVIVIIVILFWLFGLPRGRRVLGCGLALILGGAVGNLWDRISFGYVIDFIDVYHRVWHWPAFNVADSAICIGVALLILDAFWFDRAQL